VNVQYLAKRLAELQAQIEALIIRIAAIEARKAGRPRKDGQAD
jgi:hypothetical protein